MDDLKTLIRDARALGYRYIVCPDCHGRGFILSPDPNQATGQARESCRCGPSRRVFQGDTPKTFTIDEMREMIARHRER